ncbi:metal ABC transporter substrate-binding protein [Chitinimonas sp. BJYL2]|uniref:metal ABC transporter substrate-binding protein n=1 Tax=Chitinimonas sp. BJYL2 TaxID=2976696 RepID=UPI0022B47C6B|nr:metal ABC transporter substrate-binding protein [Chitinimonas sp. BJYL2]
MILRHCLLALMASASLLVPAADKLPVVASFSLLGDLVTQVGGDKVSVHTLVGPDGDAHVYQPSPRDGKTLSKARLLVVNGLGFEGWIDRLVKASAYRGARVVSSQGIKPIAIHHDHEADAHDHHHDSVDPHAWQNPAHVRQYVRNITAGLVAADPANAGYYQQRAKIYENRLTELERWADAEMARIPAAKRRVITSHDAFAYLGQRFGIVFLAPQGMNTDAEATAKGVGKLIQQARREKIRALFVENVSNPKLLEQISRETGAQVGPRLYSDALSGSKGPAPDYLTMMRYNIGVLVAGMRQN